MKRFIKVVLFTLCITSLIFATACNLNTYLPFGCGSQETENTETKEQPVIIEDSQTKFTMTMVEKNSFYYPTITGKVQLSFMPTKLEVLVEENGSFDIAEDDFTDVSRSGNNYIVSFEKTHIFGKLDKGDYSVTIKAYKQDKPYLVNYETFFAVDELYTALPVYNNTTGEFIIVMDKESNWVGPYSENELPIMPITNFGVFETSEDYFGEWE